MHSKSAKTMSAAADVEKLSFSEVQQLSKAIECEKGNKSLILIVVCHSQSSVEHLEDTYRSSLFRRANKRIIPAKASDIAKAVSRARELAKKRQKLMLLVSPYVPSIVFHISSKFHMVTVYRCGRLPGGEKRTNREDHLLIEDFSTFCNIDLRQWDDRPDELRSRQFCALGNVLVRLNLDDPDIEPHLPNLSADQKARLVHIMSGLDASTSNDSNFWDKWKGAIATILGLTTGVMKFKAGMKLTGAGFYCSHWLGVKLFGGYISTSASVSAAAPAVGMAFGVAAAVYFIPWDTLWAFFRRLVGKVWDTLCGLWDWIKSKLSSVSRARVAEDLPPPYSMSFGPV